MFTKTPPHNLTDPATLCRLADKHCDGRVVGTGGGGYNRHNLARAWTRVVQSFVTT